MPCCHALLSCPWSHPLPCQGGRGSAPRGASRAHLQSRAEGPQPQCTAPSARCMTARGTHWGVPRPTCSSVGQDPFAHTSSSCKERRGIYFLPEKAKQERPRWVALSPLRPWMLAGAVRRGGVCAGDPPACLPHTDVRSFGLWPMAAPSNVPVPTGIPGRRGGCGATENLFSGKGAPWVPVRR